jgi:hypothetical protein
VIAASSPDDAGRPAQVQLGSRSVPFSHRFARRVSHTALVARRTRRAAIPLPQSHPRISRADRMDRLRSSAADFVPKVYP